MTLRYGSVCSGIDAPSVAWQPLDWRPAFFSEIEPFPCAVLAERYGSNMPGDDLARNGVPNLGDMNNYQGWPDYDIDILVGGTPCQPFSVAGLRKGLRDPRGNLALVYLGIVDRYRPRWMVWENVPGVLSSGGGRDFGSFIGALAELGYGWAYRVIDAQYVRVDGYGRAVPQRRRRVFVVGYRGDYRYPAKVLFERESMCGNPPPRREAEQGSAGFSGQGIAGGRGDGSTIGGAPLASTGDISHCLNAGAMGRIDYETETLISHPLLAKPNCSFDNTLETYVAHSLRAEGFDASEDGTGRGTPIIPVAFDCKAGGNTGFGIGDIPTALRGEGHGGGHLAIAIQERAICENPDAGPDDKGYRDDGAAFTLEARQTPQAIAYDLRGRDGGSQFEGPHDTANIRASSGGSSRSYLATRWAVRRLMPVECERLQGFPDGYTAIAWRGKAIEACPDGPRYKALGNSMAVNCMRWIGRRIEKVDAEIADARRDA